MSFCFCSDKKDVAKKMRLIRSSGLGNCLFLCARGWGIDPQEGKQLQIPGGVPGGTWLQAKLNRA